MNYLAKSAQELASAVAKATAGDVVTVDGRIKLSSPIELIGRRGISFVGTSGAALDFMQSVSGFTAANLNGVTVWTAEIPDGLAAMKPYAAFRADGEMLLRPRLPKTDDVTRNFYRAKGCLEFDLMKAGQRDPHQTMIFGDGEVPVMRYPEVAQVRGFHWWTDELCLIERVDYERNVIYFSNRPVFTMKCENSLTEGARWYLDNVFEALDSPGEYFITPDCRTLYYVPRAGDELEGFELFVSTCEKMLKIEASEEISFENIEFKGSDRDKLNLVRTFSQAAVDVPSAIDIHASAGISFKSCRFADVGLSCVEIDKGSHHVDIEGCEFVGIGGNPVHIIGRNVTPASWKTTYPGGHFKNEIAPDIQHDIRVVGCHIADYGRIYFNACGILLRYAYNCELSDNVIHDGYYTGISVGWVWGYAPHATNHVKIENNHIYNIGKTLLSDMGGIYTLGQQVGTVVRGNRIHDIEMDSYGGWGVYLDEGSSDILVERNICYRLTAQPFHQHYGSNNLLRHNIFAFGEGGAFVITRREEHLSVILERNILVSDGTAIYAKPADGLHITDCMNLVWDYSGEAISGTMNYDVYSRTYSFPEENRRTVAEMQAGGLFAGVIVADPKFADPERGDFTLAEDSPAKALGF